MQPASTVRVFLTARDSAARLSEQSALPVGSDGAGLPRLWVDTRRRFQAIEGFGGAFTEAAAVTWLGLSAAAREQVLADYFDREAGHGYTMCRVHMNSCDFALGNYAHVEVDDDVELKSFNIHRDRQALLPFIQAALRVAGRPIKLLVSPWSPPAWMKSNRDMNHGGKLLPQYAAAWARCFVRFVQAYEAEGVPVWGVSVQNEPMATQRWDSCLYSAEAERDFVRDHLGPALALAGLGHIKIVIWDHNRDGLVERTSVVYADPAAARYIWGAGFHWYGENHFDQVQQVHDAWPDKQLLFTEGCQEGGPHQGSWDLGERYAHSMINDLNRWTVGWIDWNLLLDSSGGPNHVGNLCSAPILAELATDNLLHQSSYWTIGHFTRFIQTGARRVLCAATRQDIEASAFVNPCGSLVVVVMNRSETNIRFVLGGDWAGAQSAVADLPARAIATFVVAAVDDARAP